MSSLDPRAEELFLQALELAGEAQRAFVEERTRLEPELRREVNSLLAADQLAGGFLDRPATDDLAVELGHVAKPGTRVDGYELTRELGRGGMGVVWEAVELGLGRRVAIKLLHPASLPDGDNRARFQREAAAAGRLNESGVVQVFGVGSFEGRPYIVQELVEGGRTLADLLDERRRSPELSDDHFTEMARLVMAIARALDVAHKSGVIHRDVKPANVLLAPDGTPKLADFGLARVDGSHSLSTSGAMLGTPFYMSPEQVSTGKVDARSDVFSLCAVLYEALSLRRPFEGDRVHEVMRAISMDEVADPRKWRGRVPRDLAVIALRGLEKEPSRRFQSASELLDELRRHANHEPILSRPAGLWLRARKWMRRRPALATGSLVSGLFLILLMWALFATWSAQGVAEEAKVDLSAALAHSESSRLLALSTALREEDPGLALLLAVEGAGESNTLEGRVALLEALDRCREVRTFVGHEGGLTDVRVDPDGERLLSASEDGTARVWDLSTGIEISRFERHEGTVVSALWGSDGLWVATGDEAGTVVSWDPATGAVLNRQEAFDEAVVDLLHAEGLDLLAGVDRFGELAVWRRSDGFVLHRTSLGSPTTVGDVPSLAHWASGAGFLACSPGRALRAFAWDALDVELESFPGERGVRGVAEGSTSSYFLSADGGAESWRREPWELSGRWELGGAALAQLACDPARSVLATVVRADPYLGNRATHVDLWSLGGAHLGQLRGHTDTIERLAFRHSTGELVTGSKDGTARLWTLPTSSGQGRFDLDLPATIRIAHDATGRWVACLTSGETGRQLHWLSLEDMRTLWTSPAPRLANDLAIDPLGSFVACASAEGIVLFDTADGSRTGLLGDSSYSTVSIDSQGQRLCAVSSRFDGAHVFDKQTRKLSVELETGGIPLSWAELAPEGDYLLTVGRDLSRVHVWSLPGGELFQTFPASAGTAAKFQGTEMRRAAFDPTGAHVAIAESDGSIRLWETETARLVAVLEGSSSANLTLAFDARGEFLLCGAADGSVTLWNLATESAASRFSGHGAAVSHVSFVEATGRALSFSLWSGRARLWPLEPLPTARAALPRDFSTVEIARYGLARGESLDSR